MRKTKIFTILLMLANTALLGVLIVALLSVMGRADTPSSQAAALPPQSQDAPAAGAEDAAGDAAADAGTDELDAWIANMRELADKYSVNAMFLQELFPDKIVYQFRGDTIYAEIDPSLPRHGLDWDNLTPLAPTGEDWRHEITAYSIPLTYAAPDGTAGIFGIDVSKHQGEIDWQKVKDAGVEFVMIRVGYRGYTNGEIKLDEYFEEYMTGAAEVGLPVGVYFFSQAVNEAEALEEVAFTLQAIAPYDVSWPVVFDWEEMDAASSRTRDLAPEAAVSAAAAFCGQVREAGYTPMIYGNVGWFMSMAAGQLDEYDKWFAQYRPFPWYPYEFSIWQYSHTGSLDGIAGEVDFNISFVDYGKEQGA